jgi:hypothetical protein
MTSAMISSLDHYHDLRVEGATGMQEGSSCSVSSAEAWDAVYDVLASSQGFDFDFDNDHDGVSPAHVDLIEWERGTIHPDLVCSSSNNDQFNYDETNNNNNTIDDKSAYNEPHFYHEDTLEHFDTHAKSSESSPSSSSSFTLGRNHRRERSVSSIGIIVYQPSSKKQKTSGYEEGAVAQTIMADPAAPVAVADAPRSAAFLDNAKETTHTVPPMADAAAVVVPSTTSKGDVSFHSFQSNQWQSRFQELVEYKNVNGHCCIPTKCQINYPLAQWVKRQRYQYRLKQAGKKSTMTTERQTALGQLGFIWDLHDSVWEERLNELYDFRKLLGHCKVPLKYPPNPELAIWAKCQRRHFMTYCTVTASGKEWTSNTMTLERILKLSKVGFVFSNRNSCPADGLDMTQFSSGSSNTTASSVSVSVSASTDSEGDDGSDVWEPIKFSL